MPEVFMICGANGAGKTTAAMTLLLQYLDVLEFVNADEIARGLNPLRPETADRTAARVMIYPPLADTALFLDSPGVVSGKWHVIAEKKMRENLKIYLPETWQHIMDAEGKNA